MTRKHYIKIAELIHRNTSHELGNVLVLSDFIEEVCDYLQSENPRFDKEKFVDACYGIGQNWN